MAAPISIIVADDDKSVRLVIAQALTKQGYSVHTTATAAGMWDLSLAGRGELLITDVGFPDGDALDMLPRLLARRPDLKVIVMSARANLLTAVKSQQKGVFDYLPKPFELKQLISMTETALSSDLDKNGQESAIEAPQTSYMPLVGRSSIMQDVYKMLVRFSSQIVPVMIEAQPGSGKEDVARALHEMSGGHPDAFVVMNSALVPTEEQEAYLFGEDGAVMQAAHGTLFINNIDQLSAHAQQSLSAALEDRSANRIWPKRVVVGTTLDLRELVAGNHFREDLYFALHVAVLRLPPLQERKEDIIALALHACEIACREFNVSKSISNEALSLLQAYDWPGNVRELEFIIRRLVMNSHELVIEAHEVKAVLDDGASASPSFANGSLTDAAEAHIIQYLDTLGTDTTITDLYDKIIEQIERPLIIQTLRMTRGNQIKAAQILGLNRNTLRKKIEWLHISKDRRKYRDGT